MGRIRVENAYIYRKYSIWRQLFGDTMPTGTIVAFGGSVAPSGWLLCDGSAVSRSTFAALFAVVGITYGPGDGVNTFNVPDMRGRSTVGAGAGAGLTNRVQGAIGGEETHQLVTAELAQHNHTNLGTTSSNFLSSGANATALSGSANTTGNNGNGTAHNTMQPFVVHAHIIQT